MNMLPKIEKGQKIGIIAPAFQPDQVKLRKGIDYLLNMGYEVELGQSLSARYGYLAGEDSLRVDDIHNMFANPEINAIICARGGWGGLRLLDMLDYNLIGKNPKLFCGYSDVTTLHLAFFAKCGMPGFSGPMVAVEMSNGILEFTEKHFWNLVNNSSAQYRFDFTREKVECWQNGSAEGVLLGGCLSMLAHQLGTPYSPDYSDSILFIEDVGETPYKIDRYLAQLKQAGILSQIKGAIIGNFLECEDEEPVLNSFSVSEILRQYFGEQSYPVIYNFPYGHGMYKFTMPIGARVKLDTETKELSLQNIFRS